MKQNKRQVSPDTLYNFMQQHDFTISVLSQYMGVSESIVRGCFHHDMNRHGKPLKFSEANIQKINEALPRMAADIRNCEIRFGQGETFVNRCGREYDRSIAEQVKAGMSRFFNVQAMVHRILGWNVSKCRARLAKTGSTTYSNVERTDCDRLNDELIAIASVLDSYEVKE